MKRISVCLPAILLALAGCEDRPFERVEPTVTEPAQRPNDVTPTEPPEVVHTEPDPETAAVPPAESEGEVAAVPPADEPKSESEGEVAAVPADEPKPGSEGEVAAVPPEPKPGSEGEVAAVPPTDEPIEAEDTEAVKRPVAGTMVPDEERTATRSGAGVLSHMPGGCQALLHAHVSTLGKIPGVQEHLLPALQAAKTGNQSMQQIVQLLKDGGIDSAKDVDEVALCVLDASTTGLGSEGKPTVRTTDIVVAMTGDFDRELVPTLQKSGGDEAEKLEVGGVDVFRNGGGNLFVGQADDGALLVSGSQDAFERMATAGGDDDELPTGKTLTVSLPASGIQVLIDRFGSPVAKKLGHDVERAVFSYEAGSDQLALRIEMPDHTRAAEIGGVFKALVARWRSQEAGATEDTERRLAEVMKDATVSYEGNDVVLSFVVEEAQIESMTKELAELVAGLDQLATTPATGEQPKPTTGETPKPATVETPSPAAGEAPTPTTGEPPKPATNESPRLTPDQPPLH